MDNYNEIVGTLDFTILTKDRHYKIPVFSLRIDIHKYSTQVQSHHYTIIHSNEGLNSYKMKHSLHKQVKI